MASAVVTANSTEAQLAQLSKSFDAIKKKARSAEVHQVRSTELLHEALAEVYGFGQSLFGLTSAPGQSIVRDFILNAGQSYSKRVVANPYLALVKMAFPDRSDSSISQYSTVLRYAGATSVASSDFYRWLASEGIKGRLDEAMEYLGGAQRASNNQARLSRLRRATAKVEALPTSSAVALPTGVQAPEGFAIVLARIDASNNASIVDVLDTEQARVEPMLLRYDGDRSTPMSDLAARPLGQLFRALDMILGCTPNTNGRPARARDILIVCTGDHGKEVTLIQAVCSAYSFPGALVTLTGHLGALKAGEPYVLEADDAATMRSEFASHDNWTLEPEGRLTADNLSQAIQMIALPDDHGYRVARWAPNQQHGLTIALEEQASAMSWLAHKRADHDRQNLSRKIKATLPTALDMEVAGSTLRLALPKTLNPLSLGQTSEDRLLDDRRLAVADLEAVLTTLKPYEVGIDGWFMDTDVDDAGLALEVHVDDDRLRLVIPTLTGKDYNQVCEALCL